MGACRPPLPPYQPKSEIGLLPLPPLKNKSENGQLPLPPFLHLKIIQYVKSNTIKEKQELRRKTIGSKHVILSDNHLKLCQFYMFIQTWS